MKKNGRPTVLEPREQRKLLRLPDARTRLGRRDRALIALLLGSGARVGEVASLRAEDVKRGPDGSLILTIPTFKRRKKDKNGNKKPPPLRAVALYAPFAAPVARWRTTRPRTGWLFAGHKDSKADGCPCGSHEDKSERPHLSVRAAQRAVSGYLKQVAPDMHTHHLRHTYATDALDASDGDVWIVADQLGHVDTRQVSEVYGHVLDKHARALAVARASVLRRKGAAA